jgi:hypothetical protein
MSAGDIRAEGELDRPKADPRQAQALRPMQSEPEPPRAGWWRKALQALRLGGRGISQGHEQGTHPGLWPLGAVFRRCSSVLVGMGDALAARGADNIARQFHRLDLRSRFDDLEF